MLTVLNNSDYQQITINYTDQTVHLDPECSFDVTWSSGGGQFTNNSHKSTQQNQTDNIPKPHYKTLAKNELTIQQTASMPKSYVKYIDCEGENKANEIEYDLDREDLEWLKLINEERKEKGYNSIDDIVLEKAINLLEKESYFQYVKTGQLNASNLPLTDDDAPCCICNDAEDSNANQIIFCDMCNVAVHQECYGVPYIPEGQWLCRRCQLSPSVVVKCVLCPFTTGAFKQTADGRWVHVICAIWINEVHFANTVFLEPVEGVDFALKRRKKLTCIVCRNRMGACLQCSHRSCARSFHVTCAFYAHVRMELKEMRTKKNPDTIVNRFVYCHQHSHNGPNTEETAAAWKRDIQCKIAQARKRLHLEAKKQNLSAPIPVIPHNKIAQLADDLSIENFSDITAYWALKRQSRCGVPLIRRLQVYLGQQKPIEGRLTATDRLGISPTRGEHHIELQQGDTSSQPLMKMALLRREFERVRLLSELVKKREKLKKESLSCDEKLLSMITPVAILIKRTLEKLISKDHQDVFMHPVSEEDVPGYRKFIAHPMDFCQMQKKLEMGQYKRVADIRSDFLLMMNNCATFNRDNKYFYDYGQRIRQIGLKVIRAAEIEESKISQTLQMVETFISRFEFLSVDYINKLQSELKLKDEIIADDVSEHGARKNVEKQPKKSNITINKTEDNNNANNTSISSIPASNDKKKLQTSRKRINNVKSLNSSIDESKNKIKEQKQRRNSKKIKKDNSDESLIILEEKPSTSTENLNNNEDTEKQNLSTPRRLSTSRKCKLPTVSTPGPSEQSKITRKRVRTDINNKTSNKSANSSLSDTAKLFYRQISTPANSTTVFDRDKITKSSNNSTKPTLDDCEQNGTSTEKTSTVKNCHNWIGRNNKNKNFTYSYLTEASSAADEEDSFNEDDEDLLPPINLPNGIKQQQNNKSSKRLRKEIIQNNSTDEQFR
uniref:Bromodomain and PHD finger-containing protein n=1 Tax=Meloidogyne hapla TaxID=6305 RepID=A0A1I8AYM8_MELHA